METTTQKQTEIARLNIGKTIMNDLQEEGRSVVWLAKKVGIGRANFYYHVNNDNFSLELLWNISIAMKHNYLADFSTLLGKQISESYRQR